MSSDDRVFSEHQVRRAGLVSAAVAFFVPVAALAAALFVRWLIGGDAGGLLSTLVGLGVGLGLLLFASDYLSLGPFNRRVRRQLVEKLRRLRELPFELEDPNVYFVGLAHPARTGWLRWETDDEVGFLHAGLDALQYRGDRLQFDVAYEDIAALELVPIGAGLPQHFRRIRIRFHGDEPFEELLFCAREGDRLTRGNEVTHTLFEALQQRWQRHQRSRLTAALGAADAALSSEATAGDTR